MSIFTTLKEAYDKYILLDRRISDLEDRIKKLEINSGLSVAPDPFICKKCGKGIYRPTEKKRFWMGIETGLTWICDNPACHAIPSEAQSKRLEKA